ncbi:hypothetical protein L1889_15860 [Paenalcaligenes niemegkensis]|uniref:hypothetical protein n=1 Tax=Paenalcaligenes niemegkensis TaxID=2895469 RepID=UPI001EE7CBC1|nr:hypothetical protein [Paenalcaligenes niemegkensis]MCQ9617960.1 hypothetical protein [Paenalcaligenes niemegkensis]
MFWRFRHSGPRFYRFAIRSSLMGRVWLALHIADAWRVPWALADPKVSGCWGGAALLFSQCVTSFSPSRAARS